ncbi:MAG: hypothetical protein PHW17_09965 [Desulfobacterales bacterium]|nr:hypothetical protein [Desulfobacterales bacterium]
MTWKRRRNGVPATSDSGWVNAFLKNKMSYGTFADFFSGFSKIALIRKVHGRLNGSHGQKA